MPLHHSWILRYQISASRKVEEEFSRTSENDLVRKAGGGGGGEAVLEIMIASFALWVANR